MPSCQPQARDQLHRTARGLDERDCVLATDVLEPAVGPRDQWTLEVALSTAGRVHNSILDDIAAMGLDLALPAQSRGTAATLVLTV